MKHESYKENVSPSNPEHTQEYFDDLVRRMKEKYAEVNGQIEGMYDHESSEYAGSIDGYHSEVEKLVVEGERLDGTLYDGTDGYNAALDNLCELRDLLAAEKERTSNLFVEHFSKKSEDHRANS
jgi:hypothetical protein